MSKALLLVDIQYDFLPGGALAVPDGDSIIPFVKEIAEQDWDLIVATQDCHPRNHKSFASQHQGKKVGEVISLNGINQMLWPDHCCTPQGMALHSQIATIPDVIVPKGRNPEIDSYSGFYDNAGRKKTRLASVLRGIAELGVVGLATDYCVQFTVANALEMGFLVSVFTEGCRGITPEGCVEALNKMQSSGAQII